MNYSLFIYNKITLIISLMYMKENMIVFQKRVCILYRVEIYVTTYIVRADPLIAMIFTVKSE